MSIEMGNTFWEALLLIFTGISADVYKRQLRHTILTILR